MRQFLLGALLVLLVPLAFGQDRVVRDLRVTGTASFDSVAGTMPQYGGGRGAFWFKGKNGLYLIFSNGTYIRLDSTWAGGSGSGGSPDTVAGYYIDKAGIGNGDMMLWWNSVWTLVAGTPATLDTNHLAFGNPSGDTLRTYLGFCWRDKNSDTLFINGKLSKVKAIRFSDGTTLTTAPTSTLDGQNADSIMGKAIIWTDVVSQTDPIPGTLVQWDGTNWSQYDPTKFVWMKDEFLAVTSEAGELGELGWTLGGTAAMTNNSQTTSIAGHPGIVYPISTAATGVHWMSQRFASSYGFVESEEIKSFRVICLVDNTGTDYKARFGFMDDLNDDTPTWGIYIERDAAETNWRFVTAVGSSETRTDIGKALSTTVWGNFYVTVEADSIRCYVDGAKKAAHAVVTGPASGSDCNFGFVINPTGAVARGFKIDYVDYMLTVTR
jgi:hypothetical protein